jgi:cyclophilin family peptidyl-prolyl cis-trans isomerase
VSKDVHKVNGSFVPGRGKKAWYFTGIVSFVLVLTGVVACGVSKSGPEASKTVTIETAKGPIVIEIYPELMPVTAGNFEKLVQSNFYDGLTFHRVEDWVIQGGDPKGNGTGGPGWTIPLETSPKLKNVRGAVAMARSANPDSAGSQFYILKKDASWLDGKYAVFGKVIKGMEVVDQIAKGDRMTSVREQ